MDTPAIPFTILALAPFGSAPGNAEPGGPQAVDLGSLDRAMAAVAPGLRLEMPDHLCPAGELTLKFATLDDFTPDNLVLNQPYLRRIVDALRQVDELAAAGVSAENMARELNETWSDLPLTFTAPAPEKPAAPARITGQVDDILSMVDAPHEGTPASSVEAARIFKKQLQALLTSLLERIFGHETFRRCEAAWRGLETLLRQGPVKPGGAVRVYIQSATRTDLPEVLDILAENPPEGLPNLVVLDLALEAGARDFDLMKAFADYADEFLVPAVFWVAPGFFKVKSWSEIEDAKDLKEYLAGPSHADWRLLANHPAADKLGVTCNRFLARGPYEPGNEPETVSLTEREPPWVGPVWALAAVVAQSTTRFGWPSRFSEPANFRLKDLAFTDVKNDRALAAEMELSDHRLGLFTDARLMPVAGAVRRDEVFVPRDVTLKGGSLRAQLFISRLLQFLLYAREHLDEEMRRGDMAANLKEFLQAQWKKTEHPAPSDLAVRVDQARTGPVVSLGLTPPPAVLPGGRKLALSFPW